MAEKAIDVLTGLLAQYAREEATAEQTIGSLNRFFETVIGKTCKAVEGGNSKPIGHLEKFLTDCQQAGLLDPEACQRVLADLAELKTYSGERDRLAGSGVAEKPTMPPVRKESPGSGIGA